MRTARPTPTASRAAVYAADIAALGGGERYACAYAAALLRLGYQVDLLTPDAVSVELLEDFLRMPLGGLSVVPIERACEGARISPDVRYSLMFNVTFDSDALPNAERAYLAVHFPSPGDVERFVTGPPVSTDYPLGSPSDASRAQLFESYTSILANSQFTASWIRRIWNQPAIVVYPACDMPLPGALSKRRKQVLVCGRFFEDDGRSHYKAHRELIEAFQRLPTLASSWSLLVVGRCEPECAAYLEELREIARDSSIEVRADVSGAELVAAFHRSLLFWHGCGLGVDPERAPHRLEHFGIAVAEAMSSGVVPLVYAAGGPKEVVSHGRTGFHWSTISELLDTTEALAADPAAIERTSSAAIRGSFAFSFDAFVNRVARLIKDTT